MRHSLSAKKKKNKSPWVWAVYWVLTFFTSIWLMRTLWTGASGGVVGAYISETLFSVLGNSAYLFPPLLLYGLIVLLLREDKHSKGTLTLLTGTLLILCAVSSELTLAGRLNPGLSGGWVGGYLSAVLDRMFGSAGAALLSLGVLFIGVQILFEISWRSLLKRSVRALAEDYKAWMTARRELKNRLKIAAEKGETLPAPRPFREEKPEPAPIQEEKPRKPAPPEIHRPETAAAQESQKKTAPKKVEVNFADFKLPPTAILREPSSDGMPGPSDTEIQSASKRLEETLASFDISAHVSGVYPGPVITRYEVSPAPGVKVSSIVALSNDIALAMKAHGIRVIAPIPGKAAIGFEIPNARPAMVGLREILESSAFNEKRHPLLFALGRHADGAPAVADLEKMPHLLVAGATNSGKSVFLHSLILSILYRNTPDEVKFLMIDPKRLELTFYDWIPHLYDPKVPCEQVSVVTQPKDASRSLVALTKVMEKRYSRFEKARVKNIASFNRWAAENGEPHEFYIIVVIDELADLILQAKDVVEDSIQRLSQMARAVGIHLVLSTQRPSVDVITGVIKANLPSRVALQVTSKTDSRVIIDTIGAESLLGKGDLLYLAADAQKPSRVQGSYISEDEIRKVADFIKAQGKPYYLPPMLDEKGEGESEGKGSSSEELQQALRLILERRRVSQDLLKAHFGSSARATNILSILEVNGFIHKPEGSNRWEIFYDKIETQLALAPEAKTPGTETPAGGEVEREGIS